MEITDAIARQIVVHLMSNTDFTNRFRQKLHEGKFDRLPPIGRAAMEAVVSLNMGARKWLSECDYPYFGPALAIALDKIRSNYERVT